MRQIFKTEADPLDVTDYMSQLSETHPLRFVIVENGRQTSASSVTFMAMDGNRYTTRDKENFSSHFRVMRVTDKGTMLCCSQAMCEEEVDRQVMHLGAELRNSNNIGQRIALTALMDFLTPAEKEHVRVSRAINPWNNDAANSTAALVA